MTDDVLTNLKCSKISPKSLLVGFAYSLTPEGFPGDYNVKIACEMQCAIDIVKKHAPEERPWIGMQWEIFDALESKAKERNDDNLLLELVNPTTHVAGPPLFDHADVKGSKIIINQLKAARSGKASTEATRILARRIANDLKKVGYEKDPEDDIFDAAMLDNVKLAQYFNHILNDRTFYNKFYVKETVNEEWLPVVELHDLYRTNVGSLGVETRQLPKCNSPLNRFQAQRVNRLILEAIFPNDEVLKRGEYLSTRGVLEKLLPQAKKEKKKITYAYVFGHPKHSPRCRRQLIESAWEAGLELEPENVVDVMKGEDWPRDTGTAQMWCRTDKNWEDYERMGRARLQ